MVLAVWFFAKWYFAALMAPCLHILVMLMRVNERGQAIK